MATLGFRMLQIQMCQRPTTHSGTIQEEIETAVVVVAPNVGVRNASNRTFSLSAGHKLQLRVLPPGSRDTNSHKIGWLVASWHHRLSAMPRNMRKRIRAIQSNVQNQRGIATNKYIP